MDFYSILSLIFVGVEALVVSITLVLGLINYLREKKSERSRFVTDLYKEFITNDDLYDAMHIIEFNSNYFNNGFYGDDGNNVERKIDRLFIYLNNVLYLHKTKRINDSDFELFKYKINAVFQNNSSINYLTFLQLYSEKYRNAQCSFNYLIEYGKENNLLDK